MGSCNCRIQHGPSFWESLFITDIHNKVKLSFCIYNVWTKLLGQSLKPKSTMANKSLSLACENFLKSIVREVDSEVYVWLCYL